MSKEKKKVREPINWRKEAALTTIWNSKETDCACGPEGAGDGKE